MQDRIIRLAYLDIPGRFELLKRVYYVKGISPCLNATMGLGGGNIPMFLIVRKL